MRRLARIVEKKACNMGQTEVTEGWYPGEFKEVEWEIKYGMMGHEVLKHRTHSPHWGSGTGTVLWGCGDTLDIAGPE